MQSFGFDVEDRIAVLDSGVGGLNILGALRRRWPHGRYVYLADERFFPYGTKRLEVLKRRIGALLECLRSARAVIVACNTASAVYARMEIFMPKVLEIIGVTSERAYALSSSGRIGVIATDMTAALGGYQDNLLRLGAVPHVLKLSELVELIEARGELGAERYRSALDDLLSAKLRFFDGKGIDTLVCGCTHFGYIVDELRRHLGNINYVVSDGAAVQAVEHRISLDWQEGAECSIYTTGGAEEFEARMRLFGFSDGAEHIDI